MKNIYDFSYTTLNGQETPLSQNKGKVLLLVNTASRCGFTHQFDGLEKLYQQYKPQGLEVIAFPCNQFAQQEPLDNVGMATFCQINYNTSFPLSVKIDVNGPKADPLWSYLKDKTPLHLNLQDHLLTFVTRNLREAYEGENDIRWNFTKFLINRNGDVLARFEPRVKPKQIAPFIERALG
jgi:glutathione peroxidase